MAEPPLSPAADQIKRYRAAVDDIRSRADIAAKALSTLGTAGLSVVAVDTFADLFPLQLRFASLLWAAVTVCGFVAVGVAIGMFTIRLWRVNSPVFMSTSKQLVMLEAGKDEAAARRALQYFDTTARLNGASSLEVYAARGLRFRRVAADMADDDPRRTRLLADAHDIHEDVQATMALAAADIVRARAGEVLAGAGTVGLGLMVIVGLAAIGVGADYLDSERAGKVAVAKQCAAAGKALGEQTVADRGLPRICTASGASASSDERSIADATACTAAVKALREQKLDTSRLTDPGKACAAVTSDPPAKPTSDSVIAASLVNAATDASTCETSGPTADACEPLYEIIDTLLARRR